VLDPGRLFARSAGGQVVVEDQWNAQAASYDLVVAIGTLDTVNDLPGALRSIFDAMRPDALLIGAVSGGDTLPQLRGAMRAADLSIGSASPHVHPRIEASALAPLLSQAGFGLPVVDVDRVRVNYSSFGRLIADLRGMAATNILEARLRKTLPKFALGAAIAAFESASNDAGTTEIFEILHFAAWKLGSPEKE
jgi:NADH dehydrogenase [ubiquinone] 1 alpha subcomplex assembly factor 5